MGNHSGCCFDFLDELFVLAAVVFGVFRGWQLLHQVIEQELDKLELCELVVTQKQ